MNNSVDDYRFDPELPVEETPGYLGHVFDDFLSFGSELQTLSEFDWRQYQSMAFDLDQLDRQLEFNLGGELLTIEADASQINEFLDELPSVVANYDCPPDQGPAGGSGYVFVLRDNWQSDPPLSEQVSALRKALEKDYEILRQKYVNDPDIRKHYENGGLELPDKRSFGNEAKQ